jgi:hypothetical protein
MLCGHSAPYSATWPTSGTTRHGTAYAPPTSEHPTPDSASSSSPGPPPDDPEPAAAAGGLPTPTANDWRGPNLTRRDDPDRQTTLPDVLTLLATPTTSDANGTGTHGTGGADLRTQIEALLPTPDATRGRKTTRTSALLPGVVEALLPTPKASDGPHGGPCQRGSSGDPGLSSAVVLLLPTPVADDSGNTPADHLRKKPGRTKVTSLAVLTEHDLISAGGRTSPLLATPRAQAARTSRTAALRPDSRSAPSLEQCVEIAQGVLPREFDDPDQLPASWHGDRTKPPSAGGRPS